jgi:hypothetical protein
MYLGRHYIKKEKWVAAINRFKTILNDYDTTIYTEEAIHRLVEIHYKIGLEGEAKKYASLLGYNYLSSEWYGKTYNIFNKEYEVDKIKSEKKSFVEDFVFLLLKGKHFYDKYIIKRNLKDEKWSLKYLKVEPVAHDNYTYCKFQRGRDVEDFIFNILVLYRKFNTISI